MNTSSGIRSALIATLVFVAGAAAIKLALHQLVSREKPGAPPKIKIEQPFKSTALTTAVARIAGTHSRGGWWDMNAPTPNIPAEPVSARSTARTNDVRRNRGRDSNPKPDAEPITPEQRYQQFVAYWTNQAATSRSNFIAAAKLDDDQATRFDVLMTAMNLRLSQQLDPVIRQYQTGWHPSTEERTQMAGNINSILAETYDEMNRNMPEDWENIAASNNMSVVQFVDPQYLPFMHGVSSVGRGGSFHNGPPAVDGTALPPGQ